MHGLRTDSNTRLFADIPPTRIPQAAFADTPHRALVMVGLIALSSIVLLSGCAERSSVQAESRETPLTSGDGVNQLPLYSPDGSLVAYTSVGSVDGEKKATVYVVAAEGGDPKQVSKDSNFAFEWLDDETLLVFDSDARHYAKSDLAGNTEAVWSELGMVWIREIAPDGRVLICEFTGDNCDLSVASSVGSDDKTLLFETPQWEMEGSFGPGRDEVTVVRQNSYDAAVSELHVFSLSTNKVARTIPIPEAQNINPVWSPDRQHLVYASDQTGNLDLWVYDPSTERSVQLTTHPEDEKNPHWSPDGKSIVFRRSARTSHIFVGDPETLASRQLTHGAAVDSYPVVSPDGEWVAFARQERGIAQRSSPPVLCVVAVSDLESDSKVQRLEIPDLTISLESICWSPDASQLAFAADDGTGNVDIYRVDIEGGKPARVTITPGLDTGPSWSPDGRTIAYSRLADGETQIWTISATGGIPQQLTEHAGVNEVPVWADDSDHVAYVSLNPDWEFEVWVTSVSDRASGRRILEAGEYNIPRAWSKDGSEVLVRQRMDDRTVLSAIPLDGTKIHKVAERGKDEAEHFWLLKKHGEKYRDQVYPGGVMAFADGEEVSNIVTLRVPDLTEALHADGDWN